MSHPSLPLKFRRKSLYSNDFDDILPIPSTSSSYEGVSHAPASPVATSAYPMYDAYALDSASSTSSSPIAHSIQLPSHSSSPLEYGHSPQIRYVSSPVHGHAYASSYARAIRADDWRHVDQTTHASKPVYGSPRYPDKLSPLFPSSGQSAFSYSSPSELGDDWEDPPLTSDLDLDVHELRNEHYNFGEMDQEGSPLLRRISFSTSCERDQPFVRPSANPRRYSGSQASSRPTTGISSCFSKSATARPVSFSPPSSSFSAVSSPAVTSSTLPPSSPILSSPPARITSRSSHPDNASASRGTDFEHHPWTALDGIPAVSTPVRAKTRSLAALLNPAPAPEAKCDSESASLALSRHEKAIVGEDTLTASTCNTRSPVSPENRPLLTGESQSTNVDEAPIDYLRDSGDVDAAKPFHFPSPGPNAEAEALQIPGLQRSVQDTSGAFDSVPEPDVAHASEDTGVQYPTAINAEPDADLVALTPESDHTTTSSVSLVDDPVTRLVASTPLLVPAIADVSSITLAITITASNVAEELKAVKTNLAIVEPLEDVVKIEHEDDVDLPAYQTKDEQMSEPDSASANDESVLKVVSPIPTLQREPVSYASIPGSLPASRSGTPLADPSTLFDTDHDLLYPLSPLSSPGPSSPLSSPLSAPPSLPDIDKDIRTVDQVSAVDFSLDMITAMDIDDEQINASDSDNSTSPSRRTTVRRNVDERMKECQNHASGSKPPPRKQIFRNFTPRRLKGIVYAPSSHSTDTSDAESLLEAANDPMEHLRAEAKPTRTSKSHPVAPTLAKRSKPRNDSNVASKRRERPDIMGPLKKRPRVILSEPESELELSAPAESEDLSDVENIPLPSKSNKQSGRSDKKGPTYKAKSQDKTASVQNLASSKEVQTQTMKKVDAGSRRASSSKPKPRSPSSTARRSRTPKAPESVHLSSSPLPHDEMQGMLIEALATSRASSLPASTLYTSMMSSRPALKDAFNSSGTIMSKKEWIQFVEDALEEGYRASGVFGKVDSSAVGTADHPLEAQWFYVPDSDPDQDRAMLIKSMMPRPAKRSETKKRKQYYWKPLGKLSRWDPEDAI